MPRILARELDSLTKEQILEWYKESEESTGVFVDVIDLVNLTSPRKERLRSLVNQIHNPPEAQALDPDELNVKLRHISPRRSPTPSDAPSTPVTAGADMTAEELEEERRQSFISVCTEIKDTGGRPYDKPCLDNSWFGQLLWIMKEKDRWLDFRCFQIKMREKEGLFNKYRAVVARHQEEYKDDKTVELHLEYQTKLDEWNEYYIWERRKRRSLSQKLARAQDELSSIKAQMKYSAPNETWWERTELYNYRREKSSAESELALIQERLECARALDFNETTFRTRKLVAQLEEDTELAQQKLQAVTSQKWDTLSWQAKEQPPREVLIDAQGSMYSARILLQNLDDRLAWIESQFDEVAKEYTSSSWCGRYNRDLMQGWHHYYDYLRQAFKNKQEDNREKNETPEEKAWLDRRWPLHRLEPLQIQMAWLEREFPVIRASDTQLLTDGEAVHTDETVLPRSGTTPTSLTDIPRRLDAKNRRSRPKDTARKSPLEQVNPSKVSKPSRRSGRQLSRKQGTFFCVTQPSFDSTDKQKQQTEPTSKINPRRSTRIADRALRDTVCRSSDLVRITGEPLRCTQNDAVCLRRSARLRQRAASRARELEQGTVPPDLHQARRRVLVGGTKTTTNPHLSRTQSRVSKSRPTAAFKKKKALKR